MTILTDHSEEFDAFVSDVQQAAGLSSNEHAQQLTVATLNVLGQSVSQGQAQQLATWLPPELAGELSHPRGSAKAIDPRSFVDKVSGKIPTTDTDEATRQVAAVFQTVQARTPRGKLDHTIDQLPPGLANLFSQRP